MKVMFFKAIQMPKKPAPKDAAAEGAPDKPDKHGIQKDDVADDKPAHEHLRELADVLEARQDEGGAAAGDDPEGGAAEEGEGGDREGDEQGAGDSEFSADNVSVGDFVAFQAGDFAGSGKVSAVGDDGVTVADKSGRDHRVHWDEITGNHPAAADGDDDAAPGDDAGGDDAPPAAKLPGKGKAALAAKA